MSKPLAGLHVAEVSITVPGGPDVGTTVGAGITSPRSPDTVTVVLHDDPRSVERSKDKDVP